MRWRGPEVYPVRGHPNICVQGVHDGEDETTLYAGISSPDRRLVRAGRSPEELAQEFEPTAQSIRNWVGQAECDAGRRGVALTTAEREELNRLRRENRQLRLDFARETNTIPSKGSGSWANGDPRRA
jgi:transposase